MTRKKAYESHLGDSGQGEYLVRRKDGETSYASVWSWDNTDPTEKDDSPVWCMVYMRGLSSTFYGSAEGMRDLGERLIAAADAAEGKTAGSPTAELLRQRDDLRLELVARNAEIASLRETLGLRDPAEPRPNKVEAFDRGEVASMRASAKGGAHSADSLAAAIRLRDAMRIKEGGTCWWSDPEVSGAIDEGVSRGWALRPSTSQAEYTDAGVTAVREIGA